MFQIRLGVLLLATVLSAGAAYAQQQTTLKTVRSPEGGAIQYGVVDGATNPAGAMASVLRAVHQNCGERPQVGRVFKFRGTNTVGVFFTVINHSGGNTEVAGLVVAAMGPDNHVQAALVSDSAARFGASVNPMLKELFAEWRLGEPSAAGASLAAQSAPSSAAPSAHPIPSQTRSASSAKLHTVAASDNSETIGLPEGWSLDPHSSQGTVYANGPQGETMVLGANKTGVDPTHPWQVNFRKGGGQPLPGQMVYPYKGDLAQHYADILQAWRRSNGQPPANLRLDKIKPTPTPLQGEECVIAEGRIDMDGKGMKAMDEMMCASLIPQWGGFYVRRYQSTAPESLFGQEKDLRKAVIGSWKLNDQVIRGQIAENLRQKHESDQQIIAWGNQVSSNIRQTGKNAEMRMQAAQQQHEMQNESFERHEDSITRNGQGFSNYLLDQTVVQDNNMYNNGTVGHGTVWNSTADALVKADPKRFEIVDTPNYWRGVDY